MARTAVVLFNLGGPDGPEAVRPFLFNLFNDPAIIGAPATIRWLIARLISTRRAPVARAIYAQIGGKSPLLEFTLEQAHALEAVLDGRDGRTVRVFVAMRHWHPFADEAGREVAAFAPERIVLLPLYPQFSTTTSGSSLSDWSRAVRTADVAAPSVGVCCWFCEPGYISAQARLIRRALDQAATGPACARLLFSAHGLPSKIVERGDPYQWQIEQSAAAIVTALALPALDWRVCYQSRVGPLEWIGPSTEEEIARAGAEGRSLVVVPVAFVSEHSETLVELDIEYRKLADAAGVPLYIRVPALGSDAGFIEALADIVRAALARKPGLASQAGARGCPAGFAGCPLAAG